MKILNLLFKYLVKMYNWNFWLTIVVFSCKSCFRSLIVNLVEIYICYYNDFWIGKTGTLDFMKLTIIGCSHLFWVDVSS